MIRPGSLIAFRDGAALACGIVAAEEKGRLRVIRARGKDERITTGRVVVEVARLDAAPGPDPDERARAVDRVREAEARIERRADEVEAAVLWEIVSETGQEALGNRDLADLAFEAGDGEAQAALMLGLIRDGVHFARKGDDWIPRKPEALLKLKHERESVARRESETRAFFEAIAREPFVACKSETEARYLDALELLAVHEEGADAPVRALALEALEASGLRFERPHEGAFRLLRRIGRFADDDTNLQVRRFELHTSFPDEVQAAASAATARGFDRHGRRDLTGLEVFSIDGPRTREIDDLLSVEPLDDGVRLGVHIADPSAFVAIDDPVDREALARGLTYYMPDLKLPMLPDAIATDAASLVEGEERPALSFLVELDADGRIREHEIVRSVVRSTARLSYDEADGAIADGKGRCVESLVKLSEIAALRERVRLAAGAILLRGPEVDAWVDAEGAPQLERLGAHSESRRIVSEAMILVGELAAGFCQANGIPAIYRRQTVATELPVFEAPIDDPVEVFATRRSLKRAETGIEPGRHRSLGLEAYAQATSPIRRFQDLATQRQIVAALAGEAPPYDRETIQRIAATTGESDARARRAEQAADAFWLLRYLESRTGETFDAVVLALVPRPIVRLVETLQERPMPGLEGVEPGQSIRLRLERVNPRAGIAVLRPLS